MNKRIHLSAPHMGGLEMSYIQQAFDSNWIAPLGANVDGFEAELCKQVGIAHGVALSSGTAAIHLGLKALGVSKGDVVFCSSMTFSASANPIVYLGATPVFIDSEPNSWNMCPVALEKAFAQHRPKAVVVVNLYGQSADIDPILQLCDHYGVPVLEDAAESLGATYKGKASGTFGKVGVFSFNGNKIITTSGGGMLVSNDSRIIEKARFWATQAREAVPWYEHRELGYNYRMSNICAGIGRGQLKVLNKRITQKTNLFKAYQHAFASIEQIRMMPVASYGTPSHWLSCITVDGSVRPMDIIQRLADQNIEARPIWKPMHLQPFYKSSPFVTAGKKEVVCEQVFETGLCLPSDTNLTAEQLDRVITAVKSCF